MQALRRRKLKGRVGVSPSVGERLNLREQEAQSPKGRVEPVSVNGMLPRIPTELHGF